MTTGTNPSGATCSGATDAWEGLTQVCCDSVRHGAWMTDVQQDFASPREEHPEPPQIPHDAAQQYWSLTLMFPTHQVDITVVSSVAFRFRTSNITLPPSEAKTRTG
jgi:hypothetical protein